MTKKLNSGKQDVRFRAVCSNGDFKGKWRNSQAEAEADAAKHLEKNPNHEVEIEFEQSGKLTFVSE